MKQGVLIVLLAFVAGPLIGAGNASHAKATAATVVGSVEETMTPEEREHQLQVKKQVADILGKSGQADLSSQEKSESSSSE